MLKKSTGARTYPVQYAYDTQGRLTNMTTWQNYSTASGASSTVWKYDAYRGWMTNKMYADGKGPSYAYTVGGNVSLRTWARGITTAYSYNVSGDLSSIDYSDDTADLVYTYDRRGRQTSVTHGSATISFVLGDAGELQAEVNTGGLLSGLTVSNRFDSMLRRTTNGVWNGSSWLTQSRYAYDAVSRTVGVSDGTNSASYTFLTNSPFVSQIQFTNSGVHRMRTTKQYDGLYRLTSTLSSNSVAGVASSHAYTYDDADQRTRTTREDGSYWVHQYDSLGQIVSGRKFWSDTTPVAGQQFDYSFDDVGNRTSAAGGGDQFGTNLRFQNYSANVLNQYTSRTVPGYVDVMGAANTNATVTVNQQAAYRRREYFRAEMRIENSSGPIWFSATNIGVLKNASNPDIVTTNVGSLLLPKTPEMYAYDEDGNLTTNGLCILAWNAENRWTNSESSSTVPTSGKSKVAFEYDYQGRRIQKICWTNNGSAWIAHQTNRFIYDGGNLIAELNGANVVIRTYMWGLDLSETEQGYGGVGGLVLFNSAEGGSHFCTLDRLGNIAGLISATNGLVAATYEYSPFGRLLRADGPAAGQNPIRWSSKFW